MSFHACFERFHCNLPGNLPVSELTLSLPDRKPVETQQQLISSSNLFCCQISCYKWTVVTWRKVSKIMPWPVATVDSPSQSADRCHSLPGTYNHSLLLLQPHSSVICICHQSMKCKVLSNSVNVQQLALYSTHQGHEHESWSQMGAAHMHHRTCTTHQHEPLFRTENTRCVHCQL